MKEKISMDKEYEMDDRRGTGMKMYSHDKFWWMAYIVLNVAFIISSHYKHSTEMLFEFTSMSMLALITFLHLCKERGRGLR